MSTDRLATRLEAKLERAELKHEYKCARREAKAERKELRREAKAERKELRHEYRCARREARHGHYYSHHCGSSGQRFGHAHSFGHPAGFGRGVPSYGPTGGLGRGYYGHGCGGQPRRPGDGHTFIVGAVSKVIGWGKQAVGQAAQSRKQQGQQHQPADHYPQEQEYHQYADTRGMEKGAVSSGSAPAQMRGGVGDEKRHHSDEDGEWEDVENDSSEEAGRAPDEPLPPYEAVVRRS